MKKTYWGNGVRDPPVLNLREELIVQFCESKSSGKVFGPKKEEVEELEFYIKRIFYVYIRYTVKGRRLRWAKYIDRMRKVMNTYRILGGKPL
jgi:hypothetical protein